MDRKELLSVIQKAKEKGSTTLDLSDRGIRELPEEIFLLQDLKELNLKRNKLEGLPVEITLLKNLKELNLNKNRLKKLPQGIGKLKKLSALSLSSNELVKLPKGITQLTHLTKLVLSRNPFNKFPEEIFQIKNLEELFFGENKIKELPIKIGLLQNLNILFLGGNRLSRLPKEIAKLKKLKYLYLQYNELTELPAEISKTINLEILDLTENQLTELPKEISQLENLGFLELDNNPLTDPPQKIIDQGTKAILNYYASLSHSKISLWTSKMIIVGEGETGKSCLLDSLENLPFEKGKPTTHGIDIRTLKIPHPKKKDVTMELNTWDFGGQEIYHATHQFYLTDNSIFLLVWNARQGFESGKIYKWLETIKALAPGSPILIVATRAEKRGADLPRDELSALYPKNITGFFEIDNATGYGIPELAKVIQKQAAKLKYMGIERPAAWVEAAKEIRKQESKYMGKEELIALFRQGEVDKKNDESLLLYLHEQGEILYYPNEEELQNTIIIKPEWVSKHIAYILDSPELTKQAGFLKKALMQKIWHDLSPDLQEKFLVLMEKFDLSYRTKDNRERSLVVEKLKYEEDLRYKKLWEEKAEAREITLKYELSTIPAGIPTWFIARTHRFTKYIHWKHGALLEDEEKKHLGLIVANPNQKSVRLIVRGLMPYYFLSLLRDTFELTLSRFKGLELTRKIPCPGHNGKECPHEFELEDLERRLEKKPPRLTIECPKAMEDVDVSKLLFGISSATHEDLVEKIRKSVSKDIKKELKKEHKKQNEELIKLVQIEFLNSYKHQQEIMDITCPNVFTLKPKHKNWLTRSVESHDFELRLFCQKPGHWHPVKEGKYDIKIPKQWLITIAPYYNKIIKYLKWIAPAFLPLSGSLLSEADYADYKDEITAGGKWANKLDSVDTNGDDLDSAAYMHQASGAELRQVRELLKKADPQKVWGGLERVSTPEGHILWLCPEHKEEYK